MAAPILPSAKLTAADERPHPAGDDAAWSEFWHLEFFSFPGPLGGFVRLTLQPHQRTAWWWAYVAGPGRPLISVRDDEVPLPRRGLEVRTEGLWGELVCETPLEHWSVGMEAFGVALDDPLDASRGEWGERVAVGMDLEWEEAGPPFVLPGRPSGYGQSCEVHGEVLVGPSRLALGGWGARSHCWGPATGTAEGRWTVAGRLDEGSFFHAGATGSEPGGNRPTGVGMVQGPDGRRTGTAPAAASIEMGPDGLLGAATLEIGSLQLRARPLAHAVVPLKGPEPGPGELVRSLCAFSTETGDGLGWWEQA